MATSYSEYELKCRNAHDKNFLEGTPTQFQRLYFQVRNFTMLSRERLYDFFVSVRHVARQAIEGDIVEVGCWGAVHWQLRWPACNLSMNSLERCGVLILSRVTPSQVRTNLMFGATVN